MALLQIAWYGFIGANAKKIVTDKRLGYQVSRREVMSETTHVTGQYANGWAEQAH